MNFFHIESLPHSLATMHLLVFLFFIAKTLFLSYLAAITGGTVLSIYFRFLYKQSNDKFHLMYALDYFKKLNDNLLTPFGLGIAPLFAVVFIFIQFSSNPNNAIISALILTTILFPIGLILNKWDFKNLSRLVALENAENQNPQILLNAFVTFIFLSVIFFFTGADVSFLTGMGNIGNVGVFGAALSYNGIFSFFSIVFLGIAFAIVNFFQFEFDKYNTINSSDSKKDIFGINTEIFYFSAIAVAMLLFLKNVFLNYFVFTKEFAGLFAVSILFLLLSIYSLKFQKTFFGLKQKTFVYLSFLAFLISFGASDSILFLKSSENNIAQSSELYESEIAELKSEGKKSEIKINAEDIFFDKCVSCHAYDKKLVGPALNTVVKKYQGKKDELKNFLLSPVKIDPNYPAMPNQGLKPAEAKALAEYLFEELGIK